MKRGTPEHPKIYELMDILKRRRPEVLGYLELLWQFTAKYAPQGDIGRFSNKRIEAACDWYGTTNRLVEALLQTKWLDSDSTHRLLVHDWAAHADGTVKKRLLRDKTEFFESQQDTDEMSRQKLDNVAPQSSSVPDISSLPTGTGTPMSTGAPVLVAADAAMFDLATVGPDPYEQARDEIWAFWMPDRRHFTKAGMLTFLRHEIKANGRTEQALRDYIAAAQKYHADAGDFVLRFDRYAKLAKDGPVAAPSQHEPRQSQRPGPMDGIAERLRARGYK